MRPPNEPDRHRHSLGIVLLFSIGGGVLAWVFVEELTPGLRPFHIGVIVVAAMLLMWVATYAWQRRERVVASSAKGWFYVTDRLFGVPVRYRFITKTNDDVTAMWTHFARLRPNQPTVFMAIGQRIPMLLKLKQQETNPLADYFLDFRVKRKYRLKFAYAYDDDVVRSERLPSMSSSRSANQATYTFSLDPSKNKSAETLVRTDVLVTLLPIANLRRGLWTAYKDSRRRKQRLRWDVFGRR